jgi:hypothetical protein
MVEVRFKPADVGTVADGAITDVKINAAANISKSKLANLAITDADVSAISQSKITNLVADLAAKVSSGPLSGDKKITGLGWDSTTSEVIVDHEA